MTALRTLGVLPTIRRMGRFSPLGQMGGGESGVPQGGGACPPGRNTSSTSIHFCHIVGASLPIAPPEAGELRAIKVSQELKSKACCRFSRLNGGTASTMQGRPLVSRLLVIGVLGGVMLQLSTTGLMGEPEPGF